MVIRDKGRENGCKTERNVTARAGEQHFQIVEVYINKMMVKSLKQQLADGFWKLTVHTQLCVFGRVSDGLPICPHTNSPHAHAHTHAYS